MKFRPLTVISCAAGAGAAGSGATPVTSGPSPAAAVTPIRLNTRAPIAVTRAMRPSPSLRLQSACRKPQPGPHKPPPRNGSGLPTSGVGGSTRVARVTRVRDQPQEKPWVIAYPLAAASRRSCNVRALLEDRRPRVSHYGLVVWIEGQALQGVGVELALVTACGVGWCVWGRAS